MKNIPFIILAGGLATRLHPITITIPKALIDVSGKPFICHQLDLLNNNGIDHVILCVGHLGNLIEEKLGNKYKNIKINYSYDGDKLLGTGGAIKKAIKNINSEFGVLYGDSYLPINYKDVICHFKKYDKGGLMTVYKNNNNFDISNIIFKNGEILEYNKKVINDQMKYIDYGFSIFSKSSFEIEDQIFDLSKIIIRLIEMKQLIGFEVNERFYEIGSFNGLKDLELKLQS
jgi:MurNAc alpha-1-phosphate uridylyltransferase